MVTKLNKIKSPKAVLNIGDTVTAKVIKNEDGKISLSMKALEDVVILISNCPQLNNPCNAYNPTPVRLLIWDE